MQRYLDKKWTWITPLNAEWDAPLEMEEFTIDSDRNFTRLIRANAYHIDKANEKPLTSDIYVIVSFDIGNLDKEIEFAKKLKEAGKKIVVCYSADLRFLIGNCLISPKGTLYTELCRYADVILSGVGLGVDIYGRFSDKVIDWGIPLERLNFSTKPFNEREIDILISGSQGAECLSFELETLLMIKEKYPDIKIVHSSQEWHREGMKMFAYTGIEFVHEPLTKNLVNSKCYMNLEIRPRGGRALLDSYLCRTPFISCESTIYSRLFPDYTYSMKFNMKHISELYDKTRGDDYDTVIKKAEQLAEPLYFDNAIKVLMSKLYPE